MRLALPLICSALLLTACERGPKSCAVCQREECKGFAFRMTLANGKNVETCCPRCGLHYLDVNHQTAKTLEATDSACGEWIDATTALYVSGSDVSHCAAAEAKRDAFGCCAVTAYDRCLPSLIAFGNRENAESFQKQHGGELLAFAQLQSNQPGTGETNHEETQSHH